MDFKLIYDSKLWYFSSYFLAMCVARFMFWALGVILNEEITFVLKAIISKGVVARVDFSYVDS